MPAWGTVVKALRSRRAMGPGHLRSSRTRRGFDRYRKLVSHHGDDPASLRRDQERLETGGLRPMLPGSGRAR